MFGGVEKISGGGLKNFRGGVEKFLGGVEKFSGGGLRNFRGAIENFFKIFFRKGLRVFGRGLEFFVRG